jgi:hypothetical protein
MRVKDGCSSPTVKEALSDVEQCSVSALLDSRATAPERLNQFQEKAYAKRNQTSLVD